MLRIPTPKHDVCACCAGRHAHRLPVSRRRRFGAATRSLLTLAMLVVLGSGAVLTTQATFVDEVTMAQVAVEGGTLDMTANGGDGPGQSWSVSMNTTNMAPGDEQTGTVLIANEGTLPFTITVSTIGTDANDCYAYYFRETSAAGATTAPSWPVTIAGMGTALGSDATTAPMSSPTVNQPLADAGGDMVWETDDEKAYTLTVRMRTSCTTNNAGGSMGFTFNTTQ